MNTLAKFLNPRRFITLLDKMNPWVVALCILTYFFGLYFAIYSPEDYQQGKFVKIMYIHVPSAWMSLMIFATIGICSVACLVWRAIFAFVIANALAPIGAAFCFITLVTGSLWGKPIWGTWWVWDARLTSMLILFMLYICYIAVISQGSIYKTEKPACIIGILGCINIPIIKFSVNMWYSLHQPASIIRANGPSVAPSMLLPLMLMFVASICATIIIMRLRIKNIS